MFQIFRRPGQALIVLASLGVLIVPGIAGTRLDPEDVMVEEFQSFCADYHTPAQCTGAVRYILKTEGSHYFVQLQFEESADGFLDLLATLVERGVALKARETPPAELAKSAGVKLRIGGK